MCNDIGYEEFSFGPLSLEDVVAVILETDCIESSVRRWVSKDEASKLIEMARNREGMQDLPHGKFVIPRKDAGCSYDIVFDDGSVRLPKSDFGRKIRQNLEDKIKEKFPGCAEVKKILKQVKQITVFLCALLGAINTIAASYRMGDTVFEYEYVDDGIALNKITAPYTLTELILPNDINGTYVTEIGTNAFYASSQYGGSNQTLKSIKLPRYLKRMGAQALWNIWRLDKIIEFPDALVELSDSAIGKGPDVAWHQCESSVRDCVFWGAVPKITHDRDFRWGNYNTCGFLGYSAYSAEVYVAEEYYDGFKALMKTDNYGFSAFYGGVLKKGFALVVGDLSYGQNGVGEGCTISLNCTNQTAKIFYTIDGSQPETNETASCRLYDGVFGLAERCTIRTVAHVPGYPYYKETVLEVMEGKVASPALSSSLGAQFNKSYNSVELSCETDDAIIRFTLDGSEVTEDSDVYSDPIVISETTTVRARAYKTDWFPSEEVEQTFTRIWDKVATPVISTAGVFENASQEVSISCATDGATILYTTDGSDPTYGGTEYVGPFTIYRTTTVKAIAIKDDMRDSAVAIKTLTRQDALGQAANLFAYTLETDLDHPWTVDKTVSKDGISSVKSGAIGANGSTYIQTSVKGAGELSFWWRAKCEEPDPEDGPDGYYDYGVLKVGGVASAYLAGNDTGWQKFTTNITTTGKHVLRWEYNKDDSTSYSPDCVWLDCVQWIPADSVGFTVTTPERVPYAWLDTFGLGEELDYESAALANNGKKTLVGDWHVWQDYVAGTDPTNSLSRFYADIAVENDVPIVSWFPDLNSNGVTRVYKVWGKESLDEIRWTYPTNSSHRFFKVSLEMSK